MAKSITMMNDALAIRPIRPRQSSAGLLALEIAEVHQRRCRSPCRSQGNDRPPVRPEVLGPTIDSWIEEWHDLFRFRVYRSDVRAFEAIALNASQSQVFKDSLAAVLDRNDVIGLMRKERRALGHPTILAPPVRSFPYGSPERLGNSGLTQADAPRWARTSALMSETNRSTSQISSSSASSSSVNVPSRFCCSSCSARANAASEGRNAMISSAVGCRAKKEITSRRRPEVADQLRRNPRAMISVKRPRSGSNCLARLSGISMVNCISPMLARPRAMVKSGSLPGIRPSSLPYPPHRL
jgi:hypothetical protein